MIVFVTIAASIACWAAAECLRSRLLWTVGAALMLVHSLTAFAAFYEWSHQVALAATARQTEAVTGVASGWGLFVNYALLLVWIADAIWWWVSPSSYERRPASVAGFVHGFLVFMFVNGAIVFADGWMRVAGIVAVTAVVMSWSIRHFKRAY